PSKPCKSRKGMKRVEVGGLRVQSYSVLSERSLDLFLRPRVAETDRCSYGVAFGVDKYLRSGKAADRDGRRASEATAILTGDISHSLPKSVPPDCGVLFAAAIARFNECKRNRRRTDDPAVDREQACLQRRAAKVDGEHCARGIANTG